MNWDLTSRLNSGDNWIWVAANNTLPHNPMREEVINNRFHLVSGVDMPLVPRKWTRPSYHHGAALNKLRSYMKTRFVMILDPDFYIVRNEWINEVLKYMNDKGLAFFGVPWHPRHINKIRYSLAPHAIFADLGKVNVSNLDFMPECDDYRIKEVSIQARIKDKFLKYLLGKRRFIGMTKDTAHQLFELCIKNKDIRYEYAQTVFKPNFNLLDSLLPDRWSFIPQRPNYYTEMSFKDVGFFDADGRGWEEYFWKGDPLGFHVRRGADKFMDNLDFKINFLKNVLEEFISAKNVKSNRKF